LIHISPNNINNALDEINRVSNRYIWGFEYYNEYYEEISYHENPDKMWKADFKQLYLDRFPSLKVVKEKCYKYTNSNNVDQMYLLEKC
jgi:hypothetical protein